MSYDPNFSDVSLLLHFDGSNGSTTFTDVKGNTVTANGNARISTSISKFGGASGYFDGTTDYLTSATWNSAGQFGTGNFTVECWVHATGAPNSAQVIWSANTYGNSTGLVLRYTGSAATSLIVSTGTNSNIITSSAGWSFDEWHHVAVVRSGTTLTLYIDGVSRGSATWSNNCTDGFQSIGCPTNTTSNAFQGYLDEFRITKGVARYTSGFSVPTAAFLDSGLNFDAYSLNQQWVLAVYPNDVYALNQAWIYSRAELIGAANSDYALSSLTTITSATQEYFALTAIVPVTVDIEEQYGLEGNGRVVGATDNQYGLTAIASVNAKEITYFGLDAATAVSSVFHADYALAGLLTVQSDAETYYSTAAAKSVHGVADSGYELAAYSLISQSTQTTYELPAILAVQSVAEANYGLQAYAEARGQANADYTLNGLATVKAAVSEAYRVNLYVNVSGIAQSGYGLDARVLLSGVAQSAYDLSIVQPVIGHAESAFSIHVFTPLYGQANSGYRLNALTLSIGVTDSSYAVTTSEVFSSWAINLATGAVSKYEQFNFTSFAYDGTRLLATADDGIYVLEGDDDNGTDISAFVDIGPQTFGSPYLKRVTTAYLGLTNDDDMQLVQETDDGTISTQTMDYSGDLRLRKLLLPKGQSGNYHRFTLKNKRGADFTLDSIELIPDVLSRRRTGAHQ
jgi:hypothetical protein